MSTVKAPKGFRKGKAKKLTDCCREIRISAFNRLGCIVSGVNSDGENETVMVIKQSFKGKRYDMDKIIVVELLPTNA